MYINLATAAATQPGTGWDHVRLSWRSLDLILYWKILCSNFLQYKVLPPGCDPGGSTFLDFSRLLFTDLYFWVSMLRGRGVTQEV